MLGKVVSLVRCVDIIYFGDTICRAVVSRHSLKDNEFTFTQLSPGYNQHHWEYPRLQLQPSETFLGVIEEILNNDLFMVCFSTLLSTNSLRHSYANMG